MNSFKCETCGKDFSVMRKKARFCSISCNANRPENKARLASIARIVGKLPRKPRQKIGLKCVCKACGIEFRSKGKKSYCSEHAGKYMGGKPIFKPVCIVCGKEFVLPTANRRETCSRECKSRALSEKQSGDKSHLWQGGKTSEAMKIRNSYQYVEWRKSVFLRDDFTCIFCGKRGGKLHADHIKPFSTHPDLRLDVSNGRTLCKPCHLKTDTWGRKAISAGKAITK